MVFCVLYDIWWSIWHFASPWWGKLFLDLLWRKIMVVSYNDLQIRTLGMLRSRFHTLPYAFNACLCPPLLKSDQKKRKGFFRNRFQVWILEPWYSHPKLNGLWPVFSKFYLPICLSQASENKHNGLSKFVVVWNQILKSFRHEDLINNRWFYFIHRLIFW